MIRQSRAFAYRFLETVSGGAGLDEVSRDQITLLALAR
jgi:hypothetical protein